jgi:hypothetical protein
VIINGCGRHATARGYSTYADASYVDQLVDSDQSRPP